MAESIRNMAAQSKTGPGTFGLRAIVLGVISAPGLKEQDFAVFLDVVILPCDPGQYFPLVMAKDLATGVSETIHAASVHPVTGALHIHVYRKMVEDPSGEIGYGGRVKRNAHFYKLAEDFVIERYHRTACSVGGGKHEGFLKEKVKPALLVGCVYDEYFSAKYNEDRRGLKAANLGTDGHLARLMQLPFLARLRELMVYEQQMLPSVEELRALDAAKKEHNIGEEVAVDAVEISDSVVRLEVASFFGHDGLVLPTESRTLDGKAGQGLAITANAASILVAGTKYKDGDNDKQRAPKIGGDVKLSVVRVPDLDNPTKNNVSIAFSVTLFPDALVNMPARFVPLADALMQGTDVTPPMPFTLLSAINLAKSRESPVVDGYDGGALVGSVRGLGIFPDYRRYVETYGQRVSADLVWGGRFAQGPTKNLMVDEDSGDTVEKWIDDALDGKRTTVEKQSVVDYADVANAEGVITLDMIATGHMVLKKKAEGSEITYYVLPLVAGTAKRPAEERQDPAAGDRYVTAELRRLGKLTEGQDAAKALAADASIVRQGLCVYPAGYKAWLPIFCFVAVLAPRTPAGVDPYAPVEQPSRRRARLEAEKMARLVTPVPSVLHFPWRALIVKGAVMLPPPPPSLLVSGAVPPPPGDLGAALEDSGDDDDQRGTKRSAVQAGLEEEDAILQHLDDMATKRTRID